MTTHVCRRSFRSGPGAGATKTGAFHCAALALLFAAGTGSSGAFAQPARREIVQLDRNWRFEQRGSGPAGWLPAQVPGDVHLDLLHNHRIPDPFDRDNEAKLQWIEHADWNYETTIDVGVDLLKHDHIDLVFKGLYTVAHVYVNGRHVLDADNMFRLWRTNAKPYLHPGINALRVEFDATGKAAEAAAARNKMDAKTALKPKAFLRKAA